MARSMPSRYAICRQTVRHFCGGRLTEVRCRKAALTAYQSIFLMRLLLRLFVPAVGFVGAAAGSLSDSNIHLHNTSVYIKNNELYLYFHAFKMKHIAV